MLISIDGYEKLDDLINEDQTFEVVRSLYIKRPGFREAQVEGAHYEYFEAIHNGIRRILERTIRFDAAYQMLMQDTLIDEIPL